jgi:two-component system sensor histidine kinase CpxA
LWSFATLALSLVAFIGVSVLVSVQTAHRTGFFGQVHTLELEEAREAYEEGGPAKLARFLDRLQQRLSGNHYLTDAQGRDLLTGADRSALVAMAQPEGSPPRGLRGPQVLMVTSEDGRYHWIVELGPPPIDLKSFVPYYILIFGAVALVCWLLAVNIASPVRSLARIVDRFGAGDLTVRVNSTRKDEIGNLSRAFDRMAERIGTLLTAERRLLQDISHELRSPLARLSFAAELARTADDRDAAVERLKKEIHRLTDLVGTLLEVTMAEGDPSSTAPERFRLDDLLMEVVVDCRLEAHGRGCTIALRAGPPLAILGDREILRRAIENVVRNAMRYAPRESAVEVELEATESAASISVRDYGPGVPEEALPKIFQPFFRVDDARDSSTGRMGLGLAIAMRAVGLYHGQMRAQNAHPGLRVSIELPLGTAS